MNNPEASQQLIQTFEDIILNHRHNGLQYSNAIISAPGISDSHDPDMKYKPLYAAGFWPGGVPGMESSQYAMYGVDPDLDVHKEKIQSREIILASRIGEAAMQRITQNQHEAEKELKRSFGSLVVPTMIDLCTMRNAPVGFAIFGEIAESTVLNIGDRFASLHYPTGMPAKASLAQLRNGVRNTIDEERL